MTKINSIYESFLGKVTDYNFSDMKKESLDAMLRDFLRQAIERFKESCKHSLETEIVDGEEYFVDDLTIREQDILSEVMLEGWYKLQLNNSDLLKMRLSTKDFTQFSSANQLKEIRSTYQMIHERAETEIKRYSYEQNDVGDLI